MNYSNVNPISPEEMGMERGLGYKKEEGEILEANN